MPFRATLLLLTVTTGRRVAGRQWAYLIIWDTALGPFTYDPEHERRACVPVGEGQLQQQRLRQCVRDLRWWI
ncbi:hypothetical protein SCOCK_580039 [Actinacidiphila cocklensis]|uniref:Uncharacterized protein n=1 Tax=Actinacidiphila cocklensis TaxID=887465 RepID=A0A9W4DXC5_9ACTN|nr:hypothetical protein SCOCK_580039 [Actinacidiphila cocklensis]